MSDLNGALSLINENPAKAWFAGPRDAETILKAEQRLAGKLPPSYRSFVERLGAGSFGSFEVYGVVNESFEGPVPDGIWLTLDQRAVNAIPEDMIIVGDSGDGAWHCIRQNEDGPVLLLWPGSNGHMEVIASNFAAYLHSGVSGQS